MALVAKGKVQTSKDTCSGASILTSGCQGGSSISAKSGTVNEMVRVSAGKGVPGKEWPVLGRSDEVPVGPPAGRTQYTGERSELRLKSRGCRALCIFYFNFLVCVWGGMSYTFLKIRGHGKSMKF